MKLALCFPLLFLSACVTSYAGMAPLPFDQVLYDGPSGEPYREERAALPGIKARYGLPEAPEVTYVELNPDGARTLLFIHGLGSNLKFWRYQLDAFASQGYRVLALDMLGYGKSDKPASFPYTMEAMAEVVREVAAAANADRPILIGHSMGGQVALSFAIRFPEDLSAMVLTSPAGFERFSRREKAWFRKVFSSALVKGASEEAIWRNIRKNNFDDWQDEYEWLIEERVRVAKTPEFDQYAYANVKSVQGLTETDFVRDNLDKIKVPTLIIHGDEDRLIPNPFMHGGPTRDIMEYGHRGISGSRLITLENCGHMIQIDCSKRYNRDVSSFVEAVSSGNGFVGKD